MRGFSAFLCGCIVGLIILLFVGGCASGPKMKGGPGSTMTSEQFQSRSDARSPGTSGDSGGNRDDGLDTFLRPLDPELGRPALGDDNAGVPHRFSPAPSHWGRSTSVSSFGRSLDVKTFLLIVLAVIIGQFVQSIVVSAAKTLWGFLAAGWKATHPPTPPL